MQAVQQLVPLILGLSLAGLVLAVGLESTLGELFALFRQPGRLFRAVLAVNVIVPVAAVALVSMFPLEPAARGGILLMAVSPVPPLVPGKTLKTGAERSYGYSLYCALILLAIVIVPLTVAVVSGLYGIDVPLAPTAVARNVAITVLAPLAIGVLVHRIAPDLATRLGETLRKLAMFVVLAMLVPILMGVWPALSGLAGNGTLLAMALLSVVGLAAGHLLGGPALADRGALAVTAATRHPGIAIMIAKAAGGDRQVTAAIVGVMLVGLAVGIPYQLWLQRRRAAAPAAQPTATGRAA